MRSRSSLLLASVVAATVAAIAAGCLRQPGPESSIRAGGDAAAARAGLVRLPPRTRLLVELLDPLGVEVTHIGQPFVARVIEPPEVARLGASVLGHVADIRAGTGIQPAIISLDFDGLRVDERTWPLEARVVGADVGAPHHGIRREVVLGRELTGVVPGTVLGTARGRVALLALAAGPGTLVSLGTRQAEGRLPGGTVVGLELRRGLVLPAPPRR